MTTTKLSIKTNIRFMLVQSSANPATHNAFAMQTWVNEKKTKGQLLFQSQENGIIAFPEVKKCQNCFSCHAPGQEKGQGLRR